MMKFEEKHFCNKPTDAFNYENTLHQSTLLYRLNSLREKGELIDIHLVVGDTVFRAHKAVLAACSDYFRAMFTDNMLESKQEKIQLNGITAKGFCQLIEFAYTSRLTLDESNVQDVLEAASHVQMVEIVKACSIYLSEQIDMDNCMDIANIAETYSLNYLGLKVCRFICHNFMEFSNSEEFNRVTARQLENFLVYDFPVDCDEADILKVVLAWFLHVNTQKLDDATIARIINLIRFKNISREELDRVLKDVKDEFLNKIILREASLQCSIDDVHYNPFFSQLRGMELALLKIGGFGISGLTNDITYQFLSERSWRHLTSIPHVEQCNFGTTVFNNELYIIGGCFNQSLVEIVHSFGFKYNPRFNKWTSIAQMNVSRCRFSLHVVDDMLYAIGGATEGGEYNNTNTCEIYDPILNEWDVIEPFPVMVSQHAGASFETPYSSRLYISGGIDNTVQNHMFCYDIHTKVWTTCSPMLKPRADHTMLNINNSLYVCGGWFLDPETGSRVLVNTIDIYDVHKDSWRTLTEVPTPKYHEAVVCVDEKIYFVGGFTKDGIIDKEAKPIEYYDINLNFWYVADKYPYGIWEHTCATLFLPKDLNFVDKKCIS